MDYLGIIYGLSMAYRWLIQVFVGIVCCGGVAALTGFSKDMRGKFEVSFLASWVATPRDFTAFDAV